MVQTNYLEERRYWENFYKKYFNLEVDFSDCFAEKNSKKSILDLNSPIFIPKELNYPLLFEINSRIIQFTDKETQLKNILDWRFEESETDYSTWLDYNNYSHSGDIFDISGHFSNLFLSISLKALIVFEIYYFIKNDRYFNRNGKVFCLGSYCKRKEAFPGISWENDRLQVKLYKLVQPMPIVVL